MIGDLGVDAAVNTDDFIELGRPPKLGPYLRDLWSRREFAIVVPYQDLRAQKINTLVGQFWHFLNPLMTFCIYYVIFAVILDVTRGLDNYVGFLVIGVLMFTMMTRVLSDGVSSIERNAGLIRSVDFPRALLPIASVNGHLMAFMPALVVMAAALIATGERPSLRWLGAIPTLGIAYLINLGVGLLMARAGFAIRDLDQIMHHVTRMLFYASAVLFLPNRFVESEWGLKFFALNPYYDVLSLMRWSLMDMEIESEVVVMSVVYAVVLPVVGLIVFMRAEHRYTGS